MENLKIDKSENSLPAVTFMKAGKIRRLAHWNFVTYLKFLKAKVTEMKLQGLNLLFRY
jgi:hypothetical protein